MRRAEIRRAVLSWASTLDRPLPWRGERDPYKILVSEVMLQQTQAARVAPIYERFISRFPDVAALADAGDADVLRAWENLGYPRRALSLWRAAKVIAEHGWPTDIEGLQALPGVGAYTARAIASFGFGAGVSAVDANVRRVLTRIGATDVQRDGDALVPTGESARWNQAMIDLGAVVCRARRPSCAVCPVTRYCVWDGTTTPRRVARQRFEDSARYVRGRIVSHLRRAPSLTRAEITSLCDVEPARIDAALATLQEDGLITKRGRQYVLGSASSGA